MRGKWLMFGIPILVMVVIVACFAVTLTPVVYAQPLGGTEQPDETSTLGPTATAEATTTPTPTPTTTATQAASPTPISSPSPAPSPINISNKTVQPGEIVRIEVYAPDVNEVNITGLNYQEKLVEKGEIWVIVIKASDEAGMYNFTIFADGNEIGETSFEVIPPPPIWKSWWLIISLIGVCIASGVLIYLCWISKEKEYAKLTVQVRDKKGNGLGSAKVTVDWGKSIPKTKTTIVGGWVDFEQLPVGELCTITVKKKGYKPKTFELKMPRREKREQVYLDSAEQMGDFLEVNVIDEEKNDVKEARVRISRGINDFAEDITNEFGYCNLEMPRVKGQVYVFAEKEGYEKAKEPISMEQPPITLLVKIKRKLAELKLNVLSEENEPLSDAVVKIDDKEFFTNLRGEVKGKVSWGEHKLLITKEGYDPYEETVNVEGDTSPPKIKLTTKFGALEVTVVDKETWEPVDGIKVDVKGAPETTNKEGFVSFDKIGVGRQTIEVRDPTGVYSSEPKMVEIKEKITTPIEIKLSSSFEIPYLKMEKLRDAYRYLKDQRERVAAYDCYLPDYYIKIGEKLAGIVSDSGKSRKLLRLVREIRDIKPTVFVEDLADVISTGCMEIGKGMRERRNLEIFGDIKEFKVDKGILAKPNVKVSLGDIESADIKKYIEGGREGTEGLLREVDQALTKTAGNNYPMSVLFKVARQIMNSDASSDDKARALVASVILEYVRVMLKDDNVEERLRGLIT